MRVFVGLGNPGSEYAATKHNVGFMLADALARHFEATSWQDRFRAQVAEARLGAEKLLIVKPQTYMNSSGEAVGELARWYKLEPEDLVVAHDDMDLPVGMIRIRKKGGAGGHNGIKSIIAHLGTEEFPRVRIGIGRPLPGWDVIRHVLAPFREEDVPRIREAVEYLVPAAACLLTEGADLAMNRYNPKKQKKQKAQPDVSGEKEAGGA